MGANQFRESVYGMLEHLPEGMRRGQYLISYNIVKVILESLEFKHSV